MLEMNGFNFNLIIVGECEAGKSNIVYRWSNPLAYNWQSVLGPTLWINGATRIDQVNNMPIRINIWEFPGKESLRDHFGRLYRYADAFVLVYDITSRDSFEKCQMRLESAKRRGNVKGMFVLMGNKSDLERERQVSFEEGRSLAEEYGSKFFEISAKTGENVNYTIKYIEKEMVERREIEDEKRRIRRLQEKKRILGLEQKAKSHQEMVLLVVVVTGIFLCIVGYHTFSY